MVPLTALVLPILLSAVFVFIASSIIHMALPYHKSNYKQIPDEEKSLAAIRAQGLPPGLYFFPFSTHKEMKSPAMQEKYKQGPVGFLTLYRNTPPAMPKFLGLWFLFCLIVGVFVAYLACHTMPEGTHYRRVFRIAGTAAFMGYGLGYMVSSIWKGQPWSMTIKEMFDAAIYAGLTAGTFGWLWPR